MSRSPDAPTPPTPPTTSSTSRSTPPARPATPGPWRPRRRRTVSAAKLTGGGVPHVWESGSDSIPSHTLEIGHVKLVTPVFFRHTGAVVDSLNFEMGLEGPANGRVALVAQGET